MVDAVFEFPDYGNAQLTLALLVDTGSAMTMVGPVDADRLSRMLGIDLEKIGWEYEIDGVGGLQKARLLRARVTFMDENWQTWTRARDVVLLNARDEFDSRPSLLGTDVLRHFSVLVDFPGRAVILTEGQTAY
jgi:hypothetical protein